jgi:dTMP kinase
VLCDFEFGKLGLPEPGLVIYLEVKPEVTLEYVRKRSLETGRKMDIHELDREYMIKCYKAAVYAADKLGWVRVQCCNEEGTALLPIDEIQAKIQEATVKFLDVKE